MRFSTVLASTLMVSAAYSAVVTPTKSQEIQVEKRTQYTVQGLASELITHGIFDTASLFTNILKGGILTQTD
ncbi:MAG: hypothetical protein M5F18_12310 [Asgard group archaeon]|nr:hypothetical protein JTP64_005506 [Candida tropicalis]MCP8720061.1 hypothetical protein [Asgard group archaeon]